MQEGMRWRGPRPLFDQSCPVPTSAGATLLMPAWVQWLGCSDTSAVCSRSNRLPCSCSTPSARMLHPVTRHKYGHIPCSIGEQRGVCRCGWLCCACCACCGWISVSRISACVRIRAAERVRWEGVAWCGALHALTVAGRAVCGIAAVSLWTCMWTACAPAPAAPTRVSTRGIEGKPKQASGAAPV